LRVSSRPRSRCSSTSVSVPLICANLRVSGTFVPLIWAASVLLLASLLFLLCPLSPLSSSCLSPLPPLSSSLLSPLPPLSSYLLAPLPLSPPTCSLLFLSSLLLLAMQRLRAARFLGSGFPGAAGGGSPAGGGGQAGGGILPPRAQVAGEGGGFLSGLFGKPKVRQFLYFCTSKASKLRPPFCRGSSGVAAQLPDIANKYTYADVC
jgi:hypothetical protein